MGNMQRLPVSVHCDETGTVDGILVQTLDDCFKIDLHDVENGRYMNWNEAMEKYEDVMPSKERALLICAYLKEINRLLEENGGDILDDWYWTKTVVECSGGSAWYYGGSSGTVYRSIKYGSYVVRPVRTSA